MNETNCTVCGQDQRTLEKLSEHILGHAAERRYDATGGRSQEVAEDIKPSGGDRLREADASSSQFPETI